MNALQSPIPPSLTDRASAADVVTAYAMALDARDWAREGLAQSERVALHERYRKAVLEILDPRYRVRVKPGDSGPASASVG